MNQNKRQHRRIEKKLTMQFCMLEEVPKKWDMSTIENISKGGVKFTVPSDLKIENKRIQLQIKIPQLFPRSLELEAIVLSVSPKVNKMSCDVRAKFINVTPLQQKDLAVVEQIINLHLDKNDQKTNPKMT